MIEEKTEPPVHQLFLGNFIEFVMVSYILLFIYDVGTGTPLGSYVQPNIVPFFLMVIALLATIVTVWQVR